MSKMADLELDIQMMLKDGYRPVTIASILNIPITWIYAVSENLEEESNTEVFSPFETMNS